MKNEILEKLREKYKKGVRVELVKMDDVQAPKKGTRGTVIGVDDIGSILVHWDNGSSLNVVYGEDECIVLEKVRTICYGNTREWESRNDAIKFFVECMLSTEGAERDRYVCVLKALIAGDLVCFDT